MGRTDTKKYLFRLGRYLDFPISSELMSERGIYYTDDENPPQSLLIKGMKEFKVSLSLALGNWRP